MQQRNAVRVGRAVGGAVAALAVIPWLGAGSALATSGSDSDCATRPGGVALTATCATLGSTGGEVWVARDSSNQLKVKIYSNQVLGGGTSAALCVTKSGAYSAGSTCTDAAVASGTDVTINYALGASLINAKDPVWFAVTVSAASSSATALGQGPASPAASGSASASPTEVTSSPTPTETTGSPSASPTEATNTPTPTVTPPKSVTATPSISVLPTKIAGSTDPAVAGLAHTGGNGEMGTALTSLALLGVGGALIAAAQARRSPARRH